MEYPKNVDVHTLLSRQMESMSWDVATETHKNQNTKARAAPKPSGMGFSDVLLYCDSFNKEDGSSSTNGLFIFDVLKLNKQRPISNFIEVEIYFPFFIAQPPVDTAFQPEFFYFRHLHISIDSITKTQQIQGQNNTFHFDLELDHAGGNIYRAMYGMSKYIFTNPITDVRELRVRLSVPPNKPVAMLEDRFTATAIPSGGPDPLNRRMATSVAHNLIIGSQYTVFVENFDSTDSVFNAVINDKRGHLITAITSTDIEFTNTPTATKLGTTINSAGMPASGTLLIGERRLAFILRFRELRESSSNFITL